MTTDATGIRVERMADAESVTARVAGLITDWLAAGLARRGTAVLALSGGSTPKPLYRRLAETRLEWSRVHVVQVDERVAPAGDQVRNWTAVARDLVAPTGAAGHPMPVDTAGPDPAALDLAATAYAAELAQLADHIDVVHLGLGRDGHTASLVPGDAALTSTAAVAVTAPYGGNRRMTLTAPTINAARAVVWQVTGEGKAGALRGLLHGDPSLPAHLIRRDAAVVVADVAAVGEGLG